MVVQEMAKYLSCVEQSFKDKSTGEDVTFYKVHVIPTSDNIPLNFTCSRDVYMSCTALQPYTDVLVVLDISERRGYINVRCTAVMLPMPEDTIGY